MPLRNRAENDWQRVSVTRDLVFDIHLVRVEERVVRLLDDPIQSLRPCPPVDYVRAERVRSYGPLSSAP